MRKLALDKVYEFAKADDRVVFIGSDLGAGTLKQFQAEMPERFFMEGVNEANVVGMAAGLAAEGHRVFVNTLAVFLTRRAYEQVALDVCLHNLNVCLIGNGGGLVYAPLGPTHMAIDDLGLMRLLPNMTVIAPADEPEMNRMMNLVKDHQGPVYVRLGKGNEPPITSDTPGLQLGQAIPIRSGKDAVIITTGVTLHPVLAAVDTMATQGKHVGVLHCPTVKPLDFSAIAAVVETTDTIVVVEEHVPAAGLASAVSEWMVAHRAARGKQFLRIGLPDAFPDHYGSQADLFEHYGLSESRITDAVTRLLAGE